MKVKLKTPQIYILKLSQDEIERLYILSYRGEGGPSFPSEGRLHHFIPPDVAYAALERFENNE